MPQHDQVLANAAGATFRADANSALAALFSNSSAATEPTTMVAYQYWGDTTTGILKQRGAANTTWIPLWTMATGVMIANAALAGSASQAFSASTLSAATTIGVGAAAPAASGAGITFPSTQSASSNANTLDDYEEGLHTPTTITCSTSGTVTLNTAYDTLSYTKIGRKVTVLGNLAISAVSSPIGYFKISLPFACSNLTEGSSFSTAALFVSLPGSVAPGQFAARVDPTSTTLDVYLADVAGATLQSDSAQQLQGGSEVYLEVTYFTA